MIALRLVTILALMCAKGVVVAQEAPSVFRSDVYVVSMDIGLREFKTTWRGAPLLGVASDLFTVTLDKSIDVPVTVVPLTKKPGWYRVTFSPPDSLRDGKNHSVEITKKAVPDKNHRQVTVRRQMRFEKPSKQE